MVKKIETKAWYKSKTVWINALALIAGVATAIQGELVTGGVVTLGGVLNIILRNISKTPIQ